MIRGPVAHEAWSDGAGPHGLDSGLSRRLNRLGLHLPVLGQPLVWHSPLRGAPSSPAPDSAFNLLALEAPEANQPD